MALVCLEVVHRHPPRAPPQHVVALERLVRVVALFEVRAHGAAAALALGLLVVVFEEQLGSVLPRADGIGSRTWGAAKAHLVVSSEPKLVPAVREEVLYCEAQEAAA